VSSVGKNAVFVAAAQVLRLLMAFILLPVASRTLGEAAFGRYNLATTIMFFIMLADDLGVNMWVTREIAKHRDRVQRYLAFTIGLKFSMMIASIALLLITLKITPYDYETKAAIWIFAIYAVLTSFRDLAVAVFRAFEEMKWETIVTSVERTLITVLGIFALLSGGKLIALSWMFVVSAIVSLILSAFFLFRKFSRPAIAFDLQEFVPILKGSLAFGISMFLTTIYGRLDLMMLSVFKPDNPEIWGWYGAAHRLIDFTNFIPNVLMIAAFPALARYSGSVDENFHRLLTKGFKYLVLLAIPMIPGVIFLSEPIIRLYYGNEFLPAVPALQLLACTAGILFVNIFATTVYGASNNQKKLVFIQVMGLCLNAALNFFLIPRSAHVGAALAAVITESFVMLITLAYAFAKITRLTEKAFIPQALVATLVMTGALFFFRQTNIWLAVSASIAIYFAILFALKTVTLDEFLALKKQRAQV
jgi:O-antigen/teichoic acid export membrane protein